MRSTKEYISWSKKKQRVNEKSKRKPVRVGEVRRYYVGINIWNELSKWNDFMRPWIVLKNDYEGGFAFIAPISTKQSSVNKWRLMPLKKFPKKARLVLNQCKIMDKKRFVEVHKSWTKYSHNFVAKVLGTYTSLILKKSPHNWLCGTGT